MAWRVGVLLVAMTALAGVLAGCGDDDAIEATNETTPRAVIDLPQPNVSGSMSLEDAMAGRRSQRSYADRTLTRQELSQLLWAAQGVTDGRSGRTAPSAGGLYPLEVYVATAGGLFHYLPDGHRLEQVDDADLREPLARAGLGQEALHRAPAIFVIAGVYERTAEKYGDRAERYVHLEAGHAAQNLLLQAVAMGLASVPIGAFTDDDIAALLGVPPAEAPLYLIPVGHPVDS